MSYFIFITIQLTIINKSVLVNDTDFTIKSTILIIYLITVKKLNITLNLKRMEYYTYTSMFRGN